MDIAKILNKILEGQIALVNEHDRKMSEDKKISDKESVMMYDFIRGMNQGKVDAYRDVQRTLKDLS